MFFPTALFAAVALVACGGGGNNFGGGGARNPVQKYTDISGNWGMATSSSAASQQDYIAGTINSDSQGHISGIVHVMDPNDLFGTSGCYNALTDVSVSGTINSSNSITTTSASVDSQIFTASLTATSDGGTMSGSYSITGGCAGGDRGQVGAVRFPNMSGTWHGTVTSSVDNTTNTSIAGTLTETQSPNADGIYPVSGTVTLNSRCFTSATLIQPSSTRIGSFVAGGLMILEMDATDLIGGGTDTIYVAGAATDIPTSKNMQINYSIYGGSCDADAGNGVIARP
jgi:hypothetical protein